VTVGVLLMAHGTPASTEEIAPFYTRIRRGRPPTPEQLAELESRYDAIGGVSPLTARTLAQLDAVRTELAERAPGRFVVEFGAKHVEPLIEDTAARMATSGYEKVIGLVLTPHHSSLGSQEYLTRAADALGATTPFLPVGAWYDQPGFVRLVAQRVRDAVASTAGPVHVVFSAHSLPERVRELGDTYPEQLAESGALVADAAGLQSWSIAWQSAGRTPEPWLGPDVRDEVRRLAAEGAHHRVVVCPIGFVADHLEVLYDLDVELAAVARECGIAFTRTASLNDDPAFIAVLADVVEQADATGWRAA
jgi:ferrochelatase